MLEASRCCPGRRGDSDLPVAGGSCGGTWGGVFVRWTELRISIRSLECHERQVSLPAALASHIILCSRHPATSLAALAWPGCKCESCSRSFALSRGVQSGRQGRQV